MKHMEWCRSRMCVKQNWNNYSIYIIIYFVLPFYIYFFFYTVLLFSPVYSYLSILTISSELLHILSFLFYVCIFLLVLLSLLCTSIQYVIFCQVLFHCCISVLMDILRRTTPACLRLFLSHWITALCNFTWG